MFSFVIHYLLNKPNPEELIGKWVRDMHTNSQSTWTVLSQTPQGSSRASGTMESHPDQKWCAGAWDGKPRFSLRVEPELLRNDKHQDHMPKIPTRAPLAKLQGAEGCTAEWADHDSRGGFYGPCRAHTFWDMYNSTDPSKGEQQDCISSDSYFNPHFPVETQAPTTAAKLCSPFWVQGRAVYKRWGSMQREPNKVHPKSFRGTPALIRHGNKKQPSVAHRAHTLLHRQSPIPPPHPTHTQTLRLVAVKQFCNQFLIIFTIGIDI